MISIKNYKSNENYFNNVFTKIKITFVIIYTITLSHSSFYSRNNTPMSYCMNHSSYDMNGYICVSVCFLQRILRHSLICA